MIHRAGHLRVTKLGKNKCLQQKPQRNLTLFRCDANHVMEDTQRTSRKPSGKALSVYGHSSGGLPMQGLLRATLCAALLYPSPALLASTVFRCVDAAGHVTFTLNGCPTDQDQQLQNAHNPTPGGGKPVPMARPGKATHQEKRETGTVLVVGERQDGCGNQVTGTARREAMVKQEIRAGMTRADVESALGRPDRISRQNGQTRYHYRDAKGNSRQVSFDESGCVRGKR